MSCYIGNTVVDCASWQGLAAAQQGPAGQVGSQYWLNKGYTGAEPSNQVKAAFSTATYASSWIGQLAQNMNAAGVPGAASLPQASYPIAPQAQAVWAAFPGTAPPSTTPTGTPIVTGTPSAAAYPAPTATSGANQAPVPNGGTQTPGNNVNNGDGTNGGTAQPAAGTDLLGSLGTLLSNPIVIISVLGILALLVGTGTTKKGGNYYGQ